MKLTESGDEPGGLLIHEEGLDTNMLGTSTIYYRGYGNKGQDLGTFHYSRRVSESEHVRYTQQLKRHFEECGQQSGKACWLGSIWCRKL